MTFKCNDYNTWIYVYITVEWNIVYVMVWSVKRDSILNNYTVYLYIGIGKRLMIVHELL